MFPRQPSPPTPRPRIGPRAWNKRRAKGLGLIPLLACTAGSCGGSAPEGPPNVLLVVVDTLRADRLGCHGSRAELTPSIDALAEEGVVFLNAQAHAPWTLASFASIFTSKLPTEHGAGGQIGSFRTLSEDHLTLAEWLTDEGYETGCVTNVPFLSDDFGTLQGFSHRDVAIHHSNVEMRDATESTDAALAWLDDREQADAPWMLFLHYFDPHAVYAPPAEYRRKHAAEEDRNGAWTFGTRSQMMALRRGELVLSENVVRRAEKLYDGEVAYTDHEFGRLIDTLRERGELDNTIVVLTADHGEEFLEHGGFEHGHSLYEELTHVPWVLWFPDRVEPARIEAPVSHLDLAPTLGGLLEFGIPAPFRGRDLIPQLRDGQVEARPILTEDTLWGPRLESWRNEGHKLIRAAEPTPGSVPPVAPGGRPRPELFDLASDPGESHDLAASKPEWVERLSLELDSVQRHLGVASGGTAELDAETLALLEALGYSDGSDDPGTGDSSPR